MENSKYIKHEYDIKLHASDFDAKGRVKASSLMHVFQEAATIHAEMLGVGFEPLMAQNYIWVLTKLRFQVNKLMKANTTYHLKTYPRPKKGVTFFRDFFLYDEKYNEHYDEYKHADDGCGEDTAYSPVVIGTSQWCIINFKTRRIERTKIDFTDGTYITEEAFEDGIEKFRIHEDALAQIGSHTVTEDDLDENEHVNNCRYADMVENVLEGHTDFTIHFSKEARLGDEILLYRERLDDDFIAVAGKLADGTTVFQAKVR